MPYLNIRIDSEATIQDYEAEIEHWSEQLQIASEIGDTETKGHILKAIRWLNQCLGALENELEEQEAESDSTITT